MEYTFVEQSNAFIMSMLLGIVFWVLYDIIRAFRLVFNIKGVTLFTVDVLYMLLCSLATFLLSLAYLNGSVRFFIILGAFLAFVILHFTVGKIFCKININLVILLKRYYNKIINLFEKIIKKLLKILYKVLYNICEKIYKFVGFFKKRFKLSNLSKKGNKYGKQKERKCEKV